MLRLLELYRFSIKIDGRDAVELLGGDEARRLGKGVGIRSWCRARCFDGTY